MQLAHEHVSGLAPFWACHEPEDADESRKSGAKSDLFHKSAPLRIIVVEDEPFVRLDIEAILAAAGHDVVAGAGTAHGAIDMAEREKPDLMIMDVRLVGDGDGVEAAIEIWERFGIRSLFVSANVDSMMRARASQANPVGFIDKPFLNTTLVAALPKKT